MGFDPVASLVAALEARFGHLALFCADLTGGDVIGVKWLPEVPIVFEPCARVGEHRLK